MGLSGFDTEAKLKGIHRIGKKIVLEYNRERDAKEFARYIKSAVKEMSGDAFLDHLQAVVELALKEERKEREMQKGFLERMSRGDVTGVA